MDFIRVVSIVCCLVCETDSWNRVKWSMGGELLAFMSRTKRSPAHRVYERGDINDGSRLTVIEKNENGNSLQPMDKRKDKLS